MAGSAYSVKLDFPNVPEGELVEVPPFGYLENGKTHTVETPHEVSDDLYNDSKYVTLKAGTSSKKKSGEGGEE